VFTQFTLSAVPVFIIMGELLLASGISKRIYDSMSPLFQRVPGNLLHTNVAVCTVFGSVSGASMSTAAAVGSVAYPELRNRGYDRNLVVAKDRAEGIEDSAAYREQMDRIGEQVLQQLYMQQVVEAGIADADLQAAYEQWVAAYIASGEGEEVHARHILVENQDEAAALIERLQAGEDFAALAQEASTGPSGPSGGDLGWFRHDDMVPEFADAAFALQPGEISPPVRSPFGWHVIKVEERRSAPVPGVEAVAPSLESQLAEQAVYDRIDALRADAEIEILEPAATSD
jgi:peptidyl-prolyl cis-trans isomerase C